MLTTRDNPFNPYTNFEAWYQYDTKMGYNTMNYLARMVSPVLDVDSDMLEEEIDIAIKRILDLDLTGNYIIAKEDNS